jgi:hypothetical protein
MSFRRSPMRCAFGPEAIRNLRQAYEASCRELGVESGSNSLAKVVARKVIKIAQQGECDPERLYIASVEEIRRAATEPTDPFFTVRATALQARLNVPLSFRECGGGQ